MAKQADEDKMAMDLAYRAAERSYDPKSGVGCVIVTPDHLMALGWNGMPQGMDNEMREPILTRSPCGCLHLQDRTRPEVMHAEFNALSKFSGSTASAENSRLYTTLSPCLPCAIFAHRSKVKTVIYDQVYRDGAGIEFLLERGIEVVRI
jgi:dCMP deaminase